MLQFIGRTIAYRRQAILTRSSIYCRKLSYIPALNNNKPADHSWSKMTASKLGVELSYTQEVTSFIEEVNKLIISEALVAGTDRNNPVINFQHPEKLKELIDLPIRDEPASQGQLLEQIRQVIKYSVKTGNPRFFNQLFGGVDPYGFVGEVIAHAVNTNCHTYEIAPVFIILDQYLINKMCQLVGYEEGDGIFCPGGSFSNMNGVHLARYRHNNQLKQTGLFGSKPLQLFSQEDCHYSLKKAASFLGIGVDNVVTVKSDDRGRMIPEDLEKKIIRSKEQGNVPLFALATCGSTVLGSYDPVEPIGEVCRRHDVWLHVDAAWGGGALLSRNHKHLLNGIEKGDSVAINSHKMMGAPMQCSFFLVKEPGLLQQCNEANAEYLFMPDKFYDVTYDSGDKTLQCGRKVDSLSLWLLWKAKGNIVFEKLVDQIFDGARYLHEKMRGTEGFRLVLPEIQCANVCFWYIPPSLRGQHETKEWWEKVGKVAPIIKERMVKAGTLMIQYQPMASKGWPNFFRVIVRNPLQTTQDFDFIISEIERLGQGLNI